MHRNHGFTKDVWLYLLHSGGRSTTSEIVIACADEDAERTPERLAYLLCRMVENGNIVRYEKTRTNPHVTYGVTPQCKVPNQVYLHELENA